GVAQGAEDLVVAGGAAPLETTGTAPALRNRVVDAESGRVLRAAAASDHCHALGRGIESQPRSERPAVAQPDRRLGLPAADRITQAIFAEQRAGRRVVGGETHHRAGTLLLGIERVGAGERRDQLVASVRARAARDLEVAADRGTALIALLEILLVLAEYR